MQYIVSRHLLKISSQVHLGIKTPQFRPVKRQVATSPWEKGAERRVEVEEEERYKRCSKALEVSYDHDDTPTHGVGMHERSKNREKFST